LKKIAAIDRNIKLRRKSKKGKNKKEKLKWRQSNCSKDSK
jgi:hypothetical protein